MKCFGLVEIALLIVAVILAAIVLSPELAASLQPLLYGDPMNPY